VKINVAIAILVLIGLIGHIYTYRTHDPKFICGTDFPISWAGGKLAGTPDLYSPDAVKKIQREVVGCISEAAAFIRLPFFAAFMWPFSLLPAATAFWVYRTAMVIAEIGFIASFGRHWKWALLACVWSFPLAYDVDNGQDVSFLLLEIAAARMLLARGRSFPAGLCLSLCAAKFHLMLFLPLVIWRNRRAVAGMLTGGAILMVVCFAVAGWDWPLRYPAAIANPRIDPAPLELHNIRGLVGNHLPTEIALSLTVALAVWIVCRRATLEIALCAALCGGVLVSHHMTRCDWALLLPVGMILGVRSDLRLTRYLAVLLITPVVVWLNGVPALSRLPDLMLLALVYAFAWQTWKDRDQLPALRVAAAGAAS
jgi:hypothetical protein